MEHFEKNRNTLKRALGQLPEYQPSEQLWERIINADTQEELTEEVLHGAIPKMPAYTPPPQVWNQLAKQLDAEQDSQGRRLYLRQWISVAASLALIVSTAMWLLREQPPKVSLTYSQETVSQFNYDLELEADEATFAALETELETQNDPTLNKLQLELSELNGAREEVKTMLQSYGQDPQLVNQLSDIERVRSDIYRQIIEIML